MSQGNNNNKPVNESYLGAEANNARAYHIARNDYNMEQTYPDNLDSYDLLCGNNVFDFNG